MLELYQELKKLYYHNHLHFFLVRDKETDELYVKAFGPKELIKNLQMMHGGKIVPMFETTSELIIKEGDQPTGRAFEESDYTLEE